jgi:PGF-CTERM protein
VKIQPGVTVTWVNNDSAVHTATQMDMSGDMHDDDEEEDGIPGFASGLAVAAITAASIVATRKERRFDSEVNKHEPFE